MIFNDCKNIKTNFFPTKLRGAFYKLKQIAKVSEKNDFAVQIKGISEVELLTLV